MPNACAAPYWVANRAMQKTIIQPPANNARSVEDAVISVRELTKVYQMGDMEVRALRGIALDIWRGEMVAIMGPSGSGKSTLMNMIGCLDVPSSGTYYLDGVDVSK